MLKSDFKENVNKVLIFVSSYEYLYVRILVLDTVLASALLAGPAEVLLRRQTKRARQVSAQPTHPSTWPAYPDRRWGRRYSTRRLRGVGAICVPVGIEAAHFVLVFTNI